MKNFKRLLFAAIMLLSTTAVKADDNPVRTTILALGDSITQGSGSRFDSYTAPLWGMLYAEGYAFDFIGPKSFTSRTGAIKNCGFSGRNVEFLDSKIDSLYRCYPADVVLIHAGHNHFIEEQPVDGMIKAHRSIISKIRAINPDVKIVVAQVITSGKLPKYSYIPELNSRLAEMVEQLNLDNVHLANIAEGFDWQRHTIEDKVHPNRAGAEHIASRFMAALREVLPPPAMDYHPTIESYKELEDGSQLKVHIFAPENAKGKRPALVYFFGGGWTSGSPVQFYRECASYAERGMVAISVEYRIKMIHGTTPFESVADVKDAMLWIRANAKRLGIDAKRIAVSGSSAGGHLAASLATLSSLPEEVRPNLQLLYYPVVDTSERGYRIDDVDHSLDISPIHHIKHKLPPTLFLVGDKDSVVPVAKAEEFRDKIREFGGECELHIFPGGVHPLFNYRKNPGKMYYDIEQLSVDFLKRHGYIK